jgi:hypothetical protein
LKISVKPAAADAGNTVTVSGRVVRLRKRGLKRYRIDLQEKKGKRSRKGKRAKKGKRFATLASAKLTRRGRFAVSFQAPASAGTIKLRLRLRKGKRQLARSKVWRLSVRVPVGLASPAGPSGGPATPAPHSSRTLVLSPATVLSVPPPGQSGEVRITGSPDIQVGDIIAVGLGPGTPNGFLGRVTSVRVEGGITILGTSPATLMEALPEGEFSKHLEGGEIDSEGSSLAASPSSAPSSSSKPALRRRVSLVLQCSGGAQLRAVGTVAVNPEIDIDAGWSPFSGVHAHFIGRVTASSELSASADASASCNVGPAELFKRTLSPIEFTVGPVPVVVVPQISAYLSAEAAAQASVETEVHGSVTAEAGIEYSDGAAHPVAGFEKAFGWTPPEPEGSAHVEAKVSPTIDLLLYGVGGPEAVFNAGLAVDANPTVEPAWTLTAPVSLTAKLAVPVLGISTPTLTVYKHSFLLAQADETQIQGQIHFDEFPEDTVITNQYAKDGVIFDSPVFISQDGANPTSPVLSGTPRFVGPIVGHFVKPGTTTPTTVNLLQLDAGYIDNPGSVEIVAQLADGRTRTAVADHLGIDQISIATRGIKSFSAQAVSEEAAGFAIDNLGFSR